MTESPAWVFSGERRLAVTAPCDFLPPAALPPLHAPETVLGAALRRPLGSAPLRELARGARSVVVAIPDLSRACPNELIVSSLLTELDGAGVSSARVTVLIGCGLHRPTTDEEKHTLVGEPAARVTVRDALAQRSPAVGLGTTSLGCPVRLHRKVAEADLVITVGILEPHLYGGYSGGVKGVAIGCAAEETILWTHRPSFISRPGVELCRLDDNPFQATLREIVAPVRLAFAVNVVMNERGEASALAAGDPVLVQAALAARFAPTWIVETQHRYDVIVAGVKAPKDKNLYQASRAATYIGLAARPALADGGLLLLCADLPLGPGDGPGELNFGRLLADAGDPSELVARGLRGPLGPGGQRAFVVARVLERFRLGVCGAADAGQLASLGIRPYRSIAEGLSAARSPGAGRAPRILVVADALTTIVRGPT